MKTETILLLVLLHVTIPMGSVGDSGGWQYSDEGISITQFAAGARLTAAFQDVEASRSTCPAGRGAVTVASTAVVFTGHIAKKPDPSGKPDRVRTRVSITM